MENNEITEQDKMKAIAGLRADMQAAAIEQAKHFEWQRKVTKRQIAQSYIASATFITLLLAVLYFLLKSPQATEADLKYIHGENLINNSRRQGLDFRQEDVNKSIEKVAKAQQTLNTEREDFEKQKAIFVVAQALSDSLMNKRELKSNKPVTIKANQVNTKNINVVNAKTVIKK